MNQTGVHLPVDEQYERLHEVHSEPGGTRARVGVEQAPNLVGQIGEIVRVEGGDVGEEEREVAELLGRLPSAARGGRGGGERGLLLEEEHRGLEVAVQLAELRLVPLRVALHLPLQRREALPLPRAARGGGGGRLRRVRRRVLTHRGAGRKKTGLRRRYDSSKTLVGWGANFFFFESRKTETWPPSFFRNPPSAGHVIPPSNSVRANTILPSLGPAVFFHIV